MPPALTRSDLSALSGMLLLEKLDLGWCRLVRDADAQVLARFTALQELCLARVQARGASGLWAAAWETCFLKIRIARGWGLTRLRSCFRSL